MTEKMLEGYKIWTFLGRGVDLEKRFRGRRWNVNVRNDYNKIRTQGINMDQYYLCGVCHIQSLQHNVDPSSNQSQNEDRVFCLAMEL